MAATHPTSLTELFQWIGEDVEVNRHHGGILSVIVVISFRLNQFGVRNAGLIPRIIRILSLPLVAFCRIGMNCEMPGQLACGRRLVLAHGGKNTGFVKDAVLGDDVVVAGGSGAGVAYPKPGAPKIGDRVYIGAGVSILGDITIGDDAFIGAKALVLRSVPAGMCAFGLPAKVVGPAPARP